MENKITKDSPVHPTGLWGQQTVPGMTYRQYLAAIVLPAIINTEKTNEDGSSRDVSLIVEDAVFYADALMEALNK